MVLFFIVDGHHVVNKMLVESFIIVPIGKTIVYQETFMMSIYRTIFKYFTIGVKIAIPISIDNCYNRLCMGLISRTVPQFQLWFLVCQLKYVVGLIHL